MPHELWINANSPCRPTEGCEPHRMKTWSPQKSPRSKPLWCFFWEGPNSMLKMSRPALTRAPLSRFFGLESRISSLIRTSSPQPPSRAGTVQLEVCVFFSGNALVRDLILRNVARLPSEGGRKLNRCLQQQVLLCRLCLGVERVLLCQECVNISCKRHAVLSRGQQGES